MVHRTFMNNKVVEGRFPANEGCLFWFVFLGGSANVITPFMILVSSYDVNKSYALREIYGSRTICQMFVKQERHSKK